MNRKIAIGVVIAVVLAGGAVGYYSTCTYSTVMELDVSDLDVESRDGGYTVSFDVLLAGTGSLEFYGVSVELYGVDGARLAERELGSFVEPGSKSVSLVVPERPHRIVLTYERVERASHTKGYISYVEYQNGYYAKEGGRTFISPWCRPLH